MSNEKTEPFGATRFGDLLQEFRSRSNFTQSELSGFSTVSVRAIRNLELGQAKRPRRETVRLLADALRLGRHQRVALQLAAGLGGHDVVLEDLPGLPPGASRPLRGRDEEKARLLRLFSSDNERLAVINGLGGVGKSRLALAVAQALRADHGIAALWWSPPDPGQGENGRSTIASAGLDGLLAAHGGSAGHAVRLIGDRSVLLVLDGNDSEQVTAETVATLLDGCPNLMILQTSRAVQEGRWPGARLLLGPLPVPALNAVEDLKRVESAPAVAVILDRLADMEAGFRLDSGNAADILEICAHLDGLPRALESAASWLTVSSASELVQLGRVEPHAIAEALDEGCRDARWVPKALRHALSVLTSDQIAVLVELAHWSSSWTTQQLVEELGMGRMHAAAAVHAYLQCGLIRRKPAGHRVVFGVVHVMRAALLEGAELRGLRADKAMEKEGGYRNDAEDKYRIARPLGPAAGLLRSRPGRDDAA